MIAVAILIFAGCFAKILMIILYSILVDDSLHISESRSELIKQIKLRYSNQIKLELPIQDAGMFVSRYIYQYSKIIKFSNVLDMLGMIFMLAGIAINYEKNYYGVEVLFIATFIYLSLGLLVASERKERMVIGNIADYLVNNMYTRAAAKEHRVQVKEKLLSEEMVVPEELIPDEPKVKVATKKNNIADSIKLPVSDLSQESLIEEVISAFL